MKFRVAREETKGETVECVSRETNDPSNHTVTTSLSPILCLSSEHILSRSLPYSAMSATSQVAPPTEAGAMAHVNFRVRCETLGHGEDVYLLQQGDVKRQKVCIGTHSIVCLVCGQGRTERPSLGLHHRHWPLSTDTPSPSSLSHTHTYFRYS